MREKVDRRAGPRISLVLHKFSRGGSDRVAAYLANGFHAAGMDVELTVLCKGGEVENQLVALADDIRVHYLGRASGSRGWDLIRILPKLVRHLKDFRPDAVISTANNTSLVCVAGLSLSGLRGTRLLLKTTNPIASSRHVGVAKAIRRWTYRLAFRRATAVWTLSADETREMRAAFPRHQSIFREVINPYVTSAMLLQSSHKRGFCGKTIMTIARLTAQKRLDRLIAAFACVSDKHTRLLVLGEGEDRAKLEAQAAELNCSDRVDMPGYVSDVAGALRRADLFVLTSDYEGLPAAILEAMAANCPVLCTDCFPAARSLLEEAEGCAIIQTSDARALALQVEEALANPRPTRLRAIAERYSIEMGILSHVEALKGALDERAA